MRWTIAAILLSGCEVNIDLGDNPVEPDGATLVWALDGLEPLAAGFVYEAWIIVDGAPVTAGRFDIDADGIPEVGHFAISDDELAGLGAFVLSIEPEVGDDPAPSDTKILAGDFAEGFADLFLGHPSALGTDLMDGVAPYFLATPTTPAANDWFNGIWWEDPVAFVGSAVLPALPGGWTYEGWIVDATGPISTGRFDVGTAADSDGAGPTSGPGGFPGVPGQDFVQPPIDLRGLTVVISVEPVPDDSPDPFSLKPLVDDVVDDLGEGVPQDMANVAADSTPTGSVWVE